MAGAHIPAWRKLGLKLKSEQQAPTSSVQAEDAVSEPALKKCKLANTKEGVREGTNGVAAASGPTTSGKANAINKDNTANKEATNSDYLVSGDNLSKRTPLSDSPGDNQIPRRKSVTFSPDTKTTDGSSAKRIPHEVASSRLSRLSGVDASEIAAATRELNAMSSPAVANGSSDPTRKAKTKKKGKGKSQGTSATSREESGATMPKRRQKLLDYLETYHSSRAAWKFNKIYQTLLFKKAFDLSNVPLSYNDALHAYIAGLQGESIREKLHSEANEILERNDDDAAAVDAVDLQDENEREQVREKMERAQRAQVVKQAVEESWASFGRKEVKKKAEPMIEENEPAKANAKARLGAGVEDDEKETKGAVKKKRKRVRKRRTDVESDSDSSSSSSDSDSDSEDHAIDEEKGQRSSKPNRNVEAANRSARERAKPEATATADSGADSSSSDSGELDGSEDLSK